MLPPQSLKVHIGILEWSFTLDLQELKSLVGTPQYWAPEMIIGRGKRPSSNFERLPKLSSVG